MLTNKLLSQGYCRAKLVSTVQKFYDRHDGAMVLGKLLVPGHPTNLEYSKARAFCACGRCGWGLVGHFFSHLSFLSSFSLSLGDGPI